MGAAMLGNTPDATLREDLGEQCADVLHGIVAQRCLEVPAIAVLTVGDGVPVGGHRRLGIDGAVDAIGSLTLAD